MSQVPDSKNSIKLVENDTRTKTLHTSSNQVDNCPEQLGVGNDVEVPRSQECED